MGVGFASREARGDRAVQACLGISLARKGSRTPSNGDVVVILQLLFTYAPPFQAMFDNEAIRSGSGLGCLLAVCCSSPSWWRRSLSSAHPVRCERQSPQSKLGSELPTATDKMRSGSPGVMRERFEASHSIDVNDRRIGRQRSVGDCPQRRAAVTALHFL